MSPFTFSRVVISALWAVACVDVPAPAPAPISEPDLAPYPEPDPDACIETCQSRGYVCDEVCGASCGVCAVGECLDGQCVCAPVCPSGTCGEDGCGGVCSCPEEQACIDGNCVVGCAGDCGFAKQCNTNGVCDDVTVSPSCADCMLRLVWEDVQRDHAGRIESVGVAVDYTSVEQAEARMVDIYVQASLAASMVEATAGQAMLDSGKEFYQSDLGSPPWQVQPDGSWRFWILSRDNTADIVSGRLFSFRVALDAPTTVPLQLHVQERDDVLAPPSADEALQLQPYSDPISIAPYTESP